LAGPPARVSFRPRVVRHAHRFEARAHTLGPGRLDVARGLVRVNVLQGGVGGGGRGSSAFDGEWPKSAVCALVRSFFLYTRGCWARRSEGSEPEVPCESWRDADSRTGLNKYDPVMTREITDRENESQNMTHKPVGSIHCSFGHYPSFPITVASYDACF
jgi:hypothetical protein